MQNNLDCRLFKFSKWTLPKTKAIESIDKDFISIGYYDFVEVKKIDIENNANPLEKFINLKEHQRETVFHSFYKKNKSIIKQDSLTDFSTQDLFAFTNTGVEDSNRISYDSKKLSDFWEDLSPFWFFSLLHLEEDLTQNQIIQIVEKVQDLFREDNSNNYNAVCYFSFDYSDIIICVKNTNIDSFTKSIFCLNYDSDVSILIKDSFSISCIEKKAYKLIKDFLRQTNYNSTLETSPLIALKQTLEDKNYLCPQLSETFFVSFNIGVQNINILNKLKNYLNKNRIAFSENELLGRHDISISKNDANIIWLIQVQTFIDELSTLNQHNNLSMQDILFNCETFLRINPIKMTPAALDDNKKTTFHTSAILKLDKELSKLEKKVTELNIPYLYISPIFELRNSICSLLKNGFADAFVLCIFKSFLDFLSYVNNTDYLEKEFSVCLSYYLDNINSLAVSAMHSDRQFIQTPSFNPVFFDVPPKILAFYTGLVNLANDTMSDSTDNNISFSFVIRPGFNKEINISHYSYNANAPTSRLLTLYISEKDFYYPKLVIGQLCHEVAHYVGQDSRQRKIRKEMLVRCSLFELVTRFVSNNYYLQTSLEAITDWIDSVIGIIYKNHFYKNLIGYAEDIKSIVFEVLRQVVNNPEINTNTKIMIRQICKYSGINDYEYNIIYNTFLDFTQNEIIPELLDFSKERKALLDKIHELLSVFSETYADLQMILMLDLSFSDYLDMFKKIKFDNNYDLKQDIQLYRRIVNISILLLLNGRWKENKVKERHQNIKEEVMDELITYINYPKQSQTLFIKLYKNNNIKAFFKNNKKNNRSVLTFYETINIQEYLLNVLMSIEKNYENIQKQEARKTIIDQLKSIDDFDDAFKVFFMIQKFNEEFAKRLYLDS